MRGRSADAEVTNFTRGIGARTIMIFNLLDILVTLHFGTATVECSFSQMKMVKTRLRSRLSNVNLVRIAVEGPQLCLQHALEIL